MLLLLLFLFHLHLRFHPPTQKMCIEIDVGHQLIQRWSVETRHLGGSEENWNHHFLLYTFCWMDCWNFKLLVSSIFIWDYVAFEAFTFWICSFCLFMSTPISSKMIFGPWLGLGLWTSSSTSSKMYLRPTPCWWKEKSCFWILIFRHLVPNKQKEFKIMSLNKFKIMTHWQYDDF